MVSGVRQFPLSADDTVRRDHFLWGAENRLIEVLIARIFSGDTSAWNCFSVYGSSGTGKSLLLHHLARVWDQQVEVPALLTTGLDFSRSLQVAIKLNQVARWREEQRATSLVLVDDLDRMSRFPQSQRELTLLLDDLSSCRIPFVSTARRAPSLCDLSPQLRSRLTGENVIQLLPPDSAARQQFIRQFASRQRWSVEPAAIKWLAGHLRGSYLDIQSQVSTRLSHFSQDISTTEVIRLFACEKIDASQQVHRICQAVSSCFQVTIANLKGESRRKGLVRARNAVCHIARHNYRLSHYEIARCLGNRDHSTIIHACKQSLKLLHDDPEFGQSIDEVNQILQQKYERTSMLASNRVEGG